MRADLVDQGEVLCSELDEIEAHPPEALQSVVEIYQQEQDWLQAIKSASRFQSATNRNMQTPIGHYYCELAELSVQQEDLDQAEKYLASALRIDEQSVRAPLIHAKLQQQQEQWQAAIDHYLQAKNADPTFIPLFIDDMAQCYLKLDQGDQLEEELMNWLKSYQGVSPVLTLANLYAQKYGEAKATEFLTEQLQNRASFKGLNALIELNESELSELGDEFAYFNVLKDLIDKLLKNKPKLRCRKCGFGAKSLHWQCPSCKNWGVVKPIYGLESE